MKSIFTPLAVLLLFTAATVRSEAVSVPEIESIDFEIELLDTECDMPIDTLDVSMTNELLGTGLAKVIVRKGVKKVTKTIKEAAKSGKFKRTYPAKGPFGTLRIVTYNVGTFTKSGASKMDMAARMMKEMRADAIGLCELDSCTTRTGGTYQLADFADAMGGWNYSFARAIPYQTGSYGIGVASKRKFKVIDSWSMSLDKGKGSEQRALSVMEYDKFILATTHLDSKSADARLAQAKKINEALVMRYGPTHKVVILCGDFNEKPSGKAIKELKKNWTIVSQQGDTYSSQRPHQCIDYVMVLNNNSSYAIKRSAVCKEFKKGKASESSDHLPVYVDIKPKRI